MDDADNILTGFDMYNCSIYDLEVLEQILFTLYWESLNTLGNLQVVILTKKVLNGRILKL